MPIGSKPLERALAMGMYPYRGRKSLILSHTPGNFISEISLPLDEPLLVVPEVLRGLSSSISTSIKIEFFVYAYPDTLHLLVVPVALDLWALHHDYGRFLFL